MRAAHLAQERTRHLLTTVPVEGGVVLVLTAGADADASGAGPRACTPVLTHGRSLTMTVHTAVDRMSPGCVAHGAQADTQRDTLGDPRSVIPLLIARWWCTTCGRPEADEQTTPCPDCVFTQVAGHARVAIGGYEDAPPAGGLDRGLERIEAAQRLVVEAQLRAERLLDEVSGHVHGRLSGTAEILHDLGDTLLAAHSALSLARLVAEAR